MEKNKWWAYMHRNGEMQVKRLLSEEDLVEADESPFVAFVLSPVEADTREEAIVKLKEQLRNRIGG